jgi:hypothetical protein
MALSKTVTTPHGFSATDAYHRIEQIQFQGKTHIVFSVVIYKSALEKVPFDSSSFNCSYDLNGANPIAQGYEYLKSIPEFAGSVSC